MYVWGRAGLEARISLFSLFGYTTPMELYARVGKLHASAFEYFSGLSRQGAQPQSVSGCLSTLSIDLKHHADPCMPIPMAARGGGTGGVD